MARKFIFFISIIVTIFTVIKCSKLNVPRVLLPIFNDVSTNFTLEVSEGGCYKWTTSRLDLVQLVPLLVQEGECSSRVIVATITKERSRNTAIVLAEDIYTGQILRCDVIVDVISTLNIVTTTRELFMEEAPEAFEVRAYDDQGNEFTTLEGVQFEWTLGSPGSVLRFITFRDSPYETPSTVAAFEAAGKQGHIILLEGVKTGSVKVSVKLPHPEYKALKGIEVSLMVIANLIIEPADVYILRGDEIRFRVIQVKHGRLEQIKIPSSQYYMKSEKPDIGIIDKKSDIFTGLAVGKTRVFLHDNNVQEETGLKLPSATIYITYPNRISMTLLPNRNWAVLLGDQHELQLELYSSNEHKIHVGQGVQFKTTIDGSSFTTTEQAKNGSWLTGVGLAPGSAMVHTTLVSVTSKYLGTVKLSPAISARAELIVFPRIVITPAEVILPWDPQVKPKYEIELTVSGGDDKFLWSTTNHSIGVVTQTGVVRTHWHGQFETCASMTRNHHNRQCARFLIFPPSRLEIVEFNMESEVGKPIFLRVALYAKRPGPGGVMTEVPFTKCKGLPFSVKSNDNNFYHNDTAATEPVGCSCSSIGVVGTNAGTSKVTVGYKRDNINLAETVTVSAYRPLKLVHPTSGQTVLALGTSRYLIFNGGPRPWAGRPSEHVVKFESTNKDIVSIVDSTKKFKIPGSSDTYVLNVLCKDFGETTITLSIFNKPLLPNCKNKESSATARVICAKPKYLYLQPEMKIADTTRCPLDLSSERIIVQSYTDIDLLVNVKDSSGRKFDNISSLEFKWELTPDNLGTLKSPNGIFEKIYLIDNVICPNKSYQIVTPKSHNGILDVGATIVGYHPSVLRQRRIPHQSMTEMFSTMITLYLVDNTVVVPNSISIYNHPLNIQTLDVKQGSGYFELKLNDNQYANVRYDEASRQIEVAPKESGTLKISVNDLCLMASPVVVTLNIVYAAKIKVEMSDRVEIAKCIPAIIRFYDKSGRPMELPKMEYLDVRFSLEDSIVSMKQDQSKKRPMGEVHYIVCGIQLGETKLVFAAGRGDKEVMSTPVVLQVFQPLRIFPRNTTMLVGSIIQFTSEGGPQPDANIEFGLDKKGNSILEIQNNGILKAIGLGSTRVIGQSVSIDPVTGEQVSNSQDVADVFVIPLVGVKLTSPLTRFIVGATVPVWVTALPESLSSLTLGSIEPPLQYSWGTRCSDIVSLHGILHSTGVNDDFSNKISIHVKGLRQGHCTLELNVTVPGTTAGKYIRKYAYYHSSLDIEVIDKLKINSPLGFKGDAVLMAPFAKLQLNTNRDGLSVLKYSIHGEEQTDTHNKSLSLPPQPLLTVNNRGIVQSYGHMGRALVVITAIDDHGLQQTSNIVVHIKPIHYMLSSIYSSWMVPIEHDINVIPLGAEFKLVTTFHDNMGATFQAAHCDILFKVNRHDLIDIKRDTDDSKSLTACSLNDGVVVLKLWADGCLKMAEYLQITGEQLNSPKTDVVTSGDIICMSSPVCSKDGKTGYWSSDPVGAVVMDKKSGIGYVATVNRPTQAFVKYSLTPANSLKLKIEPVSCIIFKYDANKGVSNSLGPILKVPFLFKNAKNPGSTNNLYAGWQCNDVLNDVVKVYPFKCKAEFTTPAQGCCPTRLSDIFEVKPSFNAALGLYSCDLVPRGQNTANTSIIEANVTITVTSDNGVTSDPFVLEFLPGIHVPSSEIVVDEQYYTATLTITGLPKVLKQINVKAVDKGLLAVGHPKYVDKYTSTYEIRLIDYHWKLNELKYPMNVIVESKMTNQQLNLQAKLKSDKLSSAYCSNQMGGPVSNYAFENRNVILTVTIMLAILFATFWAYSQYMQPTINVNVRGSPRSPRLLDSSPRPPLSPAGCCQGTCGNMNFTSNSTPIRSGTGQIIRNATLSTSPELRRNRRFL